MPPKKMLKPRPKPIKDRKFTRKESFESDEARHYAQSRRPQMGLANIPGVDMQRFFAYVKFESGTRGKWIRKMDEKVRCALFAEWIRKIKDEFGFNSLDDLRDFLGMSTTTLDRMVYRNTRPIALGFVLDVAYIFGKDPSEIFPELLWMRDIWMKEQEVMIQAALEAVNQGELAAVKHCLLAMQTNATLYPFEEDTELQLNVLLKSRATLTETLTALRETHYNRIQNKDKTYTYAHEFQALLDKRIDEKFKSLRKEFDEVQKAFREPFERPLEKSATTKAAD